VSKTHSLLALLVVLSPSLSGCLADCDRSGCESFGKRASASIAQGIAGAVSLESDAVADGCQICSQSEAGLEIWAAPAAVRDAGAGCQLAGTPAPVSLTALGRYQQALDPGEYLMCVVGGRDRPCVGVTVAAGKVTTVNVKHHFGPSDVAVLDPGSATFRSDAFNCPAAGS
jgi:hypothetical protein